MDVQGGIHKIPLCVHFMHFVQRTKANKFSYSPYFDKGSSFTLNKNIDPEAGMWPLSVLYEDAVVTWGCYFANQNESAMWESTTHARRECPWLTVLVSGRNFSSTLRKVQLPLVASSGRYPGKRNASVYTIPWRKQEYLGSLGVEPFMRLHN